MLSQQYFEGERFLFLQQLFLKKYAIFSAFFCNTHKRELRKKL
jgi:hypothetical protein